MQRRRGVFAAAAAVALIGSLSVVAVPAGAVTAPPSITIGVDHASPPGHNWQYVDFFPRANVSVHQGEVVDFAWAQVADGFHNVALLPAGVAAPAAWVTWPIAQPDPDRGAGELSPLIFNNVTNFGNQPPGSCTPANPCTYDGTSNVIAPAMPTDGQSQFAVRVTAKPGTVVNYVCLVHPGMRGSFNVVSAATDATTQATASSRASSQYNTDTSGGLFAEHAADHAIVSLRGDGHRMIVANAGASAPHVEILEMLPSTLHIKPGDVIEYRYTHGAEVHTVTFTGGDDRFGEPLVPECENGPPPTDPNAPPCGGDFSQFELHVLPQPQGVTGIKNDTPAGSSGILDGDPASPLPDHFGFSFPQDGVFPYLCHIHDHMVGTVRVDNA